MRGGKVKWGELSADALRREIQEETNLEITDIQLVMVQDCIHSQELYRDAHFVLLNYVCLCVSDSAKVKLNDEAREFRWLTTREAYELPLNEPTRKLLDLVVGLRGDPNRTTVPGVGVGEISPPADQRPGYV